MFNKNIHFVLCNFPTDGGTPRAAEHGHRQGRGKSIHAGKPYVSSNRPPSRHPKTGGNQATLSIRRKNSTNKITPIKNPLHGLSPFFGGGIVAGRATGGNLSTVWQIFFLFATIATLP